MPAHHRRQGRDSPPARPPRSHAFAHAVPSHGASDSPAKEVASRTGNRRPPARQEGDAIGPAAAPKTRTLVRTRSPNVDLLEFPARRHPRVAVALQPGASLFVGGGTVEGHVRVVVAGGGRAERRRRQSRRLAIGRMSIDLLGVEELCAGGGGGPAKRAVFINLATEMLDADNPPPRGMAESPWQTSPLDPFWPLAAGATNVPFLLSLPLDVGPPPFQSKHARIRYVLGVTILIRDQGKQYLVRASQDIAVISVYDRRFGEWLYSWLLKWLQPRRHSCPSRAR
jgi:hypothetical protein